MILITLIIIFNGIVRGIVDLFLFDDVFQSRLSFVTRTSKDSENWETEDWENEKLSKQNIRI